jgi:hypothetical protein
MVWEGEVRNRLTQDTERWWAVMNTVVYLSVSQKKRAVSWLVEWLLPSQRRLLHEVSYGVGLHTNISVISSGYMAIAAASRSKAYCFLQLEHWVHGFESDSTHGCLYFICAYVVLCR